MKDFKKETGAEKINIVAHSKGGLDARIYLANNLSNNDVANLIMIGTPNAGSPLAAEAVKEGRIFCEPALFDLVPGAPATQAKKNPNTNYFTISGNWVSQFIPFTIIDKNCPEDPFTFSFLDRGRSHIPGPDDGRCRSRVLKRQGLPHLGLQTIAILSCLAMRNMIVH